MTPRPQQPGYVLLVVMVAVLLLVAAGTVLALDAHGRMNVVRDQYRNVHLMSLLDSGLATAAARLRAQPSYQGDETVQLGEGRVVVTVGPSATPGLQQVTLDAIYKGETRRGNAQIFAEVGKRPKIYGLQVTRGSIVVGSDD